MDTADRFGELERAEGKSYGELLYEEGRRERVTREAERQMILDKLREEEENNPELTFKPKVNKKYTLPSV